MAKVNGETKQKQQHGRCESSNHVNGKTLDFENVTHDDHIIT